MAHFGPCHSPGLFKPKKPCEERVGNPGRWFVGYHKLCHTRRSGMLDWWRLLKWQVVHVIGQVIWRRHLRRQRATSQVLHERMQRNLRRPLQQQLSRRRSGRLNWRRLLLQQLTRGLVSIVDLSPQQQVSRRRFGRLYRLDSRRLLLHRPLATGAGGAIACATPRPVRCNLVLIRHRAREHCATPRPIRCNRLLIRHRPRTNACKTRSN